MVAIGYGAYKLVQWIKSLEPKRQKDTLIVLGVLTFLAIVSGEIFDYSDFPFGLQWVHFWVIVIEFWFGWWYTAIPTYLAIALYEINRWWTKHKIDQSKTNNLTKRR